MEETAAQRRRRRLRAEVSRRAVVLFAEQGYAATSTEQVAAAADVSRSTLFRLFADKEDLLFGLEDDLLASAREAVAQAPADLPPWAAVRSAAVAVAGQVAALRDLLLTREHVVAGVPALQSRAAAKLRRWEGALAEGLGARGVPAQDAQLLAKLVVACFEVALAGWLAGEPGDLPDLLTAALDRLPELLRA
ncbi:TetR/AcrR family transcriptional regulator [Geodermatophilus aquaeductus]|uniref:Transcriptional regulator, TetR family n=1 Tax=Geodermatophilus aquaeductus TaxID=1564161 RepID=A0A521DCH7_9ACTN|nr:TetR/AcrR family transcriptional regulator [Geodermatophilus aquaeductus]SMO69389.1 transcriptional regulator, TetR family [Geodermatophilus aquaeductus]